MKDLGYSDGYKYPHDYPGHFTPQQYMPDALQNERLWHAQHSPVQRRNSTSEWSTIGENDLRIKPNGIRRYHYSRVIEFLGTFAFAISGIRHAAAKHFDWFGGYVCGIAVAIGGGTIRDVMLETTPFWMTNPIYIICTALALLFVIIFAKHMEG